MYFYHNTFYTTSPLRAPFHPPTSSSSSFLIKQNRTSYKKTSNLCPTNTSVFRPVLWLIYPGSLHSGKCDFPLTVAISGKYFLARGDTLCQRFLFCVSYISALNVSNKSSWHRLCEFRCSSPCHV